MITFYPTTTLTPTDLGTVFGGLDDSLAGQRLHAEEDVGGPAALVLVVHASQRTRGGRYGGSGVLHQLLARLVDADLGALGVIRSLVDLKHVFHCRNERGVVFRRDAEPTRSPRLQLDFLSTAGRFRN
jgi:hypothetical protein